MINTTTQEPLRVTAGVFPAPVIQLPYSQLAEVRQLLDQHGIRYRAGENAISWNGGPETIMIHLDLGTDVDAVQAILDRAR